MSTQLHRRTVLRGLSLAALAVSASSILAGCADSAGGSVTPSRQQVSGAGDLQLVSSDVRRQPGDPDAVAAVVAGIHGLGAALFAALRGDGTENLALSPYSAELALALTVNGAAGTTRTEMLDVLGVSDLDRLDGGLNQLGADLEALAGPVKLVKGAEIVLESANALFGQQGERWKDAFLDTLARDFGAGMQTVDWVGATEPARLAVNAWTAQRTHDRITEILPTGSVDETTRLVLVNALYFKAPWATAFEKPEPAGAFTLTDGTAITAPTMSSLETVPYAEGDGWRAARIPYAGGTLAMSVLLPDDLGDLESRITGGELPQILATFDDRPAAASLTMPTWTFSTQSDLTDPLRATGMPTAFDADADFTAMTDTEPLAIDRVVQQVFVAVDEHGTEAAAATAVTTVTFSASLPGEALVLDRPFLFCLHDVEHGTPLFLGRVADPRG